MDDREKVINGLIFTAEMILFDPRTGEDKEPDQLNPDDRITYDACVGAIKLLKEKEPICGCMDEWIDFICKYHEAVKCDE